MGKQNISEFWLYRWRYWIGYALIGLALIVMLAVAGLYLPGGITEGEQNSVVKSASFDASDPWSFAITNLPYHLLQWASISILGVSSFSIKLPSLIVAFFAAIIIMILFRRWFKTNIAVLASAIALTTGQFVFLAQHGSPGIMYIFFPAAILLLATLITHGARASIMWKILLAVTATLSLYTPLSIYVLLALAIATIIHPHLRYVVRRIHRGKLAVALLFGLVLLAPLGAIIYSEPTLALELLGIPTTLDLLANVQQLGSQYFNFTSSSGTVLMTPVFGLGSMLIIAYGVFRLIRDRSTVQSHVILTWLALVLPILALNPNYTSITFMPMLLLLATGLSYILRSWYRLFPLNPYARIAGLLPLIILVGSLVMFGLDRYAYGYHYSPDTVANFNRDLELLPGQTSRLVVAEEERVFWGVVGEYNDIEILHSAPDEGNFTTTRLAQSDDTAPSHIIVSPRADEADRFYIYEVAATEE